MAKVNSINVTSVKTEYMLEDETGTILGVAWRDGVRIKLILLHLFYRNIGTPLTRKITKFLTIF
jgi:hypothetical protein